MTQSQLNRAVSNATGEDFEVIERRGFSLVDEDLPADDEDLPQFIDWDKLDDERLGRLRNRQHRSLA